MVEIRVFIEGGIAEVNNRPDLADIFNKQILNEKSFQNVYLVNLFLLQRKNSFVIFPNKTSFILN
jgi:hypothetical protein